MTISTALIVIAFILSIIISVVGVYAIIILKELRETIKKVNQVLDDTHRITSSVSNPVTAAMEIINSIFEGLKTIKSFRSLINSERKEK